MRKRRNPSSVRTTGRFNRHLKRCGLLAEGQSLQQAIERSLEPEMVNALLIEQIRAKVEPKH